VVLILILKRFNDLVMLRGITLFRCSKCGKIFSAPDIELNATTFSVPQPCKRCGSIRTYPLIGFLFKSVYKKIWEQMEKKKT
jgi:DNA-directed RNA polymerase subunit RPC12/RpoP